MGQIQSLLFGDSLVDANTLLENALKGVDGVRVLALARDEKGPDRMCEEEGPKCLVCYRHVPVYSFVPCAHTIMCSSCYQAFLKAPLLVCPMCHADVTGVI